MRKVLSLLVVLVLAVLITACGDNEDRNNNNNENVEQNNNGTEGNNNDDQNNENNNEDNIANDDGETPESHSDEEHVAVFEDLLSFYEENGLDVGEPIAGDPEGAKIINADYVIIVPVDDIDVQMYYFEDQDSDEYQQALDENKITIDFEGEDIDLEIFVHDGYGIFEYEYHVAGDQMVEKLEEF